MAFDQQKFYMTSEGFPGKEVPAIYSNDLTEVALSEAEASGYYDDAVPQLKLDDLIYAIGAGGGVFYYVSGVNPVTIAAYSRVV